MIRITKPTLRLLNAAVGKLDVDTGKVFAGFVGRLEMADRMYCGELHYTDVGDKPPEEEVSIQTILSPDEDDDDLPASDEVPIPLPDEATGESLASEEG